MRRCRYIGFLMMTVMLLVGGMTSEVWAAKVTYHILTLPIDPSRYNYQMRSAITGWRLEAIQVTVNNQSTLELPAQYKSPLATGFTYYNADDIVTSGTVQNLFDNGSIKGMLYKVRGEDTPDPEDDPTSVAEGTTLPNTTVHYYVVYTYNASNGVAKLDGSEKYNIRTKYKDGGVFKDKGFIALNRGRNNRPAVIPMGLVNPEMLSTGDFIKVDVEGTGVSGYWKDGNNKNKEALVSSRFFFEFKFEGEDPYNIIVRTAYAKDTTYIEKNDGTNNFVYKWYKGGSLFSVSAGNNCYIASDEHKLYNLPYDKNLTENPTVLTEGDGTGYTTRTGNYHGQTGIVWNAFTLLNNTANNGYVFMVTRAVDGNGATPTNLYYLKEKESGNNLTFATGNSTDNLSIERFYPLEKVTFKVATPFYKVTASNAHIVSVADEVSKYTVDNDPIETKYLPAALKRKYCNFNGKFYKDAACTQTITHFSQAIEDPIEGYQVYVGYDLAPSAPKFITPAASYDSTVWAQATWYELTDDGSTQEHGRKIKYNAGSTNYKNNGANGSFDKTTEFAFVGDPYELKVIDRGRTAGASGSATYVELSGHNTWDMPNDETAGSFLLHEYKGTGYWNWNAGHTSVDVAYHSDPTISPDLDKNAQTIIINLSGLNSKKYYKITTGGEGAGQIASVTPKVDNTIPETSTTATIVVTLKANTSGADKTMTITIQEYNNSEGSKASESPANPSVITINQSTAEPSFAGSVVSYSTSSSTRVKVLDLPKCNYSYKIVDKSGRIAIKASAEQPIFSSLSLASIPSIIVSPFILNETVKFYGDDYTDGTGRGNLTTEIFETPGAADDIFVTYTTTKLDEKPIKLSERQEFNVVLNGRYLWYDHRSDPNIDSVKTKDAPSPSDLADSCYLWKLRNRDPYAMLVDNLGARSNAYYHVAGQVEAVTIYDDNGNTSTESREKGVWVDLATIENAGVLSFTTDRADAQRFVAKSNGQSGVYEVMVATGESVDASTTYYNIGCPAENTVKIYDKAHYAHSNDVLRFRLEQTIPYTYHLIDKSKKELMVLTSQSPDLALPDEYQSPLVATYHFYDSVNMKLAGGVYDTIVGAEELKSIYDLDAEYETTAGEYSTQWAEGGALTVANLTELASKAKKLDQIKHYYYKVTSPSETYYDVSVTKPYLTHIYVTYDANERVQFNTGAYMLKFLEPYAEGYHLEDGNDKLTSSKIQAVYPYCNGDGNLNIYGNDMQKEQFNGGASTRPRWVWNFVSENEDPYHVRIRSKSTVSYKGIANNTYLTTYAVHFNQDELATTKHIVTGGTLPGVAAEEPTEYMVLGRDGEFKLLTTEKISDGENIDHRKVTSFEQYWKTYNMIKKCVLEIDVKDDATYKDAYSDDTTTWVVPAAKRADLETKLSEKGVGTGQWHSYSEYANAVRWNGYNDKSDGHEKKVVEKLEHWYQTFDMGNGTFDIENADIPPVLVLLDLHGWEIMRLPLPTVNYPEGDDELAALRAYDSPLVKEYKFYSNATKATGCHKYTLRLNDKGEERDQIKDKGKHYISTSLGDLPPIDATGVKSSGAFNDQFVTYTVKEEYADSYKYTFTDNGDNTYSESGTPSQFLILQNSRFYRYISDARSNSYFSKPIHEASNPPGGNIYDAILDPCYSTVDHTSTSVDDNKDGIIDNINLWYIQPNLNIDKEMGIKWGTSNDITAAEPLSEYGTKKKYKDITGFDPYNIQLKNVDQNKFVTSHQTSARIENGILVGTYPIAGDTTNLTLATEFSYAGVDPLTPTGSEGYDHTNLKISNQTFMAVSDANGNMQLMPRFSQTKRVNLNNSSDKSYTTLQAPVDHAKASASDNSSMGEQTMFFVRSQITQYHIINNSGKEALRYKRSGEYKPTISDHFKSPLAKNFTYYKGFAEHGDVETSNEGEWDDAAEEFQRTLTKESMLDGAIHLLPKSGTYYYKIGTRGIFSYKKVVVTKGFSEQQIKGTFAEAGLKEYDCDVKVRYEYDAGTDHDGDRILEGRWFTTKLANKDMKADGTVMSIARTAASADAYTAALAGLSDGVYYFRQTYNTPYTYKKVTVSGETKTDKDSTETAWTNALGLGVSLLEGASKPSPIDEDDKEWQWKFLSAPADPSSDYYVVPDPYDVQLYNRHANYTKDPSAEPSPMAVGIKVPDADRGVDHFALLSHTSGGYALAVAGTETYTYQFLNGASMTTSVSADTATEASFTQKAGIFDGVKSQLLVIDDVERHFTYMVINKSAKFAASAKQNNAEADAHDFFPYLPDSAQSPLLNMEDYAYYGFARPTGPGTHAVIPQTILYTLYGLYDDTVYVRYADYSVDKTSFKIPNRKATDGGHVARDPSSVDVSMNIEGGLPYNIVWYDNNMMEAVDGIPADENYDGIDDGGNQHLSGNPQYVWYFTGNDPYALKIKHKGGKYLNGSATLVDEASAATFMLLRKANYDYGVLQLTGITGADAGKKLTGYGAELTPNIATAPTKFIVFGLSVHDLIYHLIIAKTCPDTLNPQPGEYIKIPYRTVIGGALDSLTIFGTTQRDLTTKANAGNLPGSKYQLGDTVMWNGAYHTYSYHAGSVSIGDELVVPNVFARPNCTFMFYVEGVYTYNTDPTKTDKPIDEMNNKYQGLKLDKLMSDDQLIDQTVVVNIVYEFDTTLTTNTGLGFVTSKEQNLWYTFETKNGDVPYLAHYTNAWGLQAMRGAETRYTNDYLWTPLGDVYGFKMYNRYMLKNSGGTENIMTMNDTIEGENLYLAVPGTTERPGDKGVIPEEFGIFELVSGNKDGYFRVHPVANLGETKYYVKRSKTDYAVLSTMTSDSTDWMFGLDMILLEPYYERAGYVGGLNAAGKAAYEAVLAEEPFKIIDLQAVVYDDANIVHYEPGYYRLHNQPGASGISPVRYASGYLHDIERSAVSGGIPMHFFSKEGVSVIFDGAEDDLGTGFTITNATRGDIPIPATEADPSTIFYFGGTGTLAGNPRSTIQTQGLYVAANDNGDANKGTTTSKKQRAVMSAKADSAITFSLMDIGGAVLLIHDGETPNVRRYLNYDQSRADSIYDLRYYHESPTDDAKWCMQPVQKTPTAGNGEKPLVIPTNQGGDGYYYATFYAPFDILLPNNKPGIAGRPDTTYNAYICKKWHYEGVNPSPVPATSGVHPEGKFVPAGTPVILRTNDESNIMTLTLPSSSPSTALSCEFTGSYLEKLLEVDATRDVYTFGLPMTTEARKDGDYDETGDIYAPKPEFATSGVGFYINATPDKESDPLQSLWQRKNNYVLHNKIYYRAPLGPASAPENKTGVEYVPVIFGDGEEVPKEEQQPDENQTQQRVGDGCAYDIVGRKVASEAAVKNGTWYQGLTPGIYIVNGQKIYVGY